MSNKVDVSYLKQITTTFTLTELMTSDKLGALLEAKRRRGGSATDTAISNNYLETKLVIN